MHCRRRKMPRQPVGCADPANQRIDGNTADFSYQFLGGKSERGRIDLQERNLVERSDRRGTLAFLAVQEPDFADDVATRQLGKGPIALLYLDLALDDEPERLARVAVLHDDRGRRQDAPGRQPQQFPYIDVIKFAQERQAAHGLPLGLVRQHLPVLEDLEAHRRQVLGHVGAKPVT